MKNKNNKTVATIHRDISVDDFIKKANKSTKMSVGFGMPGIECGNQFDKAIIEEEGGRRAITFESSYANMFFKFNLGMLNAKYRATMENKGGAEISVHFEEAPFINLIVFLRY